MGLRFFSPIFIAAVPSALFFVNLFIRVQRAVNISVDVGRDLKRKEEEKYNIINKRTVTTIKTKVNWGRS